MDIDKDPTSSFGTSSVICTLITDINSSPFLTIFYKFISIFTYIQIISQSLFPSDLKFWKTSKCSSFSSLFAFFARIVPEGSSDDLLQIVIIFIFFSMIIFSIICLWFFFSYSNLLFRSSHSPIILMIPVGLSKIILIPSFSLLFHECNYFTNVTSAPGFILLAMSVFCCVMFSYFFALIGNVVPCFSGNGNLSWITKDFIFEIGYIITIVLQSEFFSVIKSHTIRVMLLITFIFFHLFVIIFYITTNIKSRLFNFFGDLAHLSFLISNILFLIREYIPIDSGAFLQYYIVSLIFAYSIIIFIRNIYKKYIYTISRNYLQDRDCQKILKFPLRIIMVILCTIYPNINDDFEYLDLIVNNFTHNYQILFLYAKFLVLNPDEKRRMRKVIKDMKKIQGIDFVHSLQTRFIQLLVIQFDLNCELSLASREKFSRNEVSNYFSSLQMFWTEVLLSKPDKLLTLSVNANNNFLDVVHNYAMNGISLDQFKRLTKICFISKSRLLNERSKTTMKIISENRFFNTNKVIDKLKASENQIPNISREIFESKSVTSSILTWQHFSFYIPFYFAIFAILFFGIYQFFSNSLFWPYFNFFKLMVNVTNYFAGSEGMIPFIVAVESDIINSSEITKFVINSDFYKTSLLDPRQDAIYNAEITNSLFDHLKETLLTFFNSTFVNNLTKTTVCSEKIGNTFHSLSFIPCLEVTRVKTESLINLQVNDLQKIMTSEESKKFFYSTLNLISYMSSYAYEMTDWIPPLLDEREVRINKSLMMIIYIVAFFSFVMSIISIFFLMRSYNHFFKSLVSIPKNEVSNLISKLGSSNSRCSQYPLDVRYNINLLSYKSPPSSFHSNKVVSFTLVIVDFVLILSAALFIIPLENSLLSCIRAAFVNMNEMKMETIVTSYCFRMYYSLNQVVYLLKTNQTNNENYQFFLNILKKTIDEAYTNLVSYMANCQPRVIKNFYEKLLVNGYTLQNSFQIMSMILYEFYSDLNNGKDPSELNLAIGSVFRFMDNAVPALSNKSNDALYEMKLNNNKMKGLRFFIYLTFLILVFVIVDTILRPFKNGSALLSVPLSTISLSEPESDPSITTGNDLLNSKSIFPKLGQYIILVDKNNMIIKATEDTLLFFDIEPNTITIDQFVSRIEKYPTEHVFPPEQIYLQEELSEQQNDHQKPKSQQEDENQANFNGPITIFVDSRIPSIDSVNGQDIFLQFEFIRTELDGSSYAVIIDDLTINQAQIATLNEEANKLRMLMSQLVPWQVAPIILSSIPFQPHQIPKLALATFFIENADLDENVRIHRYLNEGLQNYPNLTFLGRSVSSFQIATPLFDQNLNVAQFTNSLVRFSFNFVQHIKEDATLYSQPKIRKNSLNQHSMSNINTSCSICNVGSVGSFNLANISLNDISNQNDISNYNFHISNIGSSNKDSVDNFPIFSNNFRTDKISRNPSSSTVSSNSKRGINKSNSCDITINPAKGNMLIEKKEQLRVRCGIILDGPFYTNLIEMPPYFSLCGKPEEIGFLISMNCTPNQVNISRAAYEVVYDLNKTMFENEVFTLSGQPLQVYAVVKCNEP